MLSEGLKCYFRDPIFQNLPRVHALGPPWQLAPNKSNLATALQSDTYYG